MFQYSVLSLSPGLMETRGVMETPQVSFGVRNKERRQFGDADDSFPSILRAHYSKSLKSGGYVAYISILGISLAAYADMKKHGQGRSTAAP